jgi:hypothetical protein
MITMSLKDPQCCNKQCVVNVSLKCILFQQIRLHRPGYGHRPNFFAQELWCQPDHLVAKCLDLRAMMSKVLGLVNECSKFRVFEGSGTPHRSLLPVRPRTSLGSIWYVICLSIKDVSEKS